MFRNLRAGAWLSSMCRLVSSRWWTRFNVSWASEFKPLGKKLQFYFNLLGTIIFIACATCLDRMLVSLRFVCFFWLSCVDPAWKLRRQVGSNRAHKVELKDVTCHDLPPFFWIVLPFQTASQVDGFAAGPQGSREYKCCGSPTSIAEAGFPVEQEVMQWRMYSDSVTLYWGFRR